MSVTIGGSAGSSGNVTYTTDLYYLSSTSVGYTAATSLLSAIGKDYGSSDTTTSTVTAGTTGTSTNDGSTPILVVGTSQTTVNAGNYSAIIDNSTGPTTIYVSNNSGTTTVVAGSGGGVIKMADGSDAVIVAGDGNYIIGNQSNSGNLTVTAGNGNNTINYINTSSVSSGLITTGTGSNVINLDDGAVSINLNGLGVDTVNAGVGSETVSVTAGIADHVLISVNNSSLVFYNGTAASTIRGGTGSVTIGAEGSGGTVYLTAESYNFFGTNGSESITDISGGNNTLVAGAYATTIDASGNTGSDLLKTGAGDSTLVGSTSGNTTFEIDSLATGSHSITIGNWLSSDTLDIQGSGGAGPTSEVDTSAGAVLTLADGTTVTLTGVTVADVTGHITYS